MHFVSPFLLPSKIIPPTAIKVSSWCYMALECSGGREEVAIHIERDEHEYGEVTQSNIYKPLQLSISVIPI
jgi:hypothetical protein